MLMEKWIKEPTIITKEVKQMWFDNHNRKFMCQICGNDLVEGKKFASMFSNFSNHHGGNPFVGECCMELPYKTRLAIWDQHLIIKKNIYKMAYDQVMIEIGEL